MASYLRPRRGKKATAVAQLTASAPLKRGEIFFEVPDTGVGTGKGKIKMGDGTTAYASLPYFMEQPTVDYTNAVVGWTNTTAADSSPYTTNATYVSNIIPSASLKTIFTNLKKLLLNYNSQLTTLNNDLDIVETSFQNGCNQIASTITSLGVETAGTDSPTTISNNIKLLVDNSSNMVKYTSVEEITTASGKTSAPITYTATEDLDCSVMVSLVGSGVGGGNYTTKILIDDIEIVSSINDFFILNNARTKFVSLKKDQTLKIINTGKATTSTDYQYTYGSKLYKFIE